MKKKYKLGCLCFANDGGLGAQTRRLAQILNPDRIMIVDSSSFSPNPVQHFNWYDNFNAFVANGWPISNEDVKCFLPNLTHVLMAENPYNFGLIYWAQAQGAKVYVQSNYEFCDNLDKPWLPLPDKFLMPSYWKMEEMIHLFGEKRVTYLPPIMHQLEFVKGREINMGRTTQKKRFVHIIGTLAQSDRNGTFDLLAAIPKTKSDFELVIRSQHPLTMDVFLDDPRVTYEVDNVRNNADLFLNFDALILPRRWGGLSLTLNEAMMSGLPAIMTDISPNNQLLPHEWLVKSVVREVFMARTKIDVFSTNADELAKKIDEFATMNQVSLSAEKHRAYELAKREFASEELKTKYLELFNNG